MSFDSEFNYLPIKNFINARIVELQSEKSNSISKVNMLGNISSQFSSLTGEIIDYHNKILEYIDTPINKLGNVLNEIIVVESLPSETKNVLYDFYDTHVKNPLEEFNYKVHWMKQMVYNTQEIVPYINSLLNEENMTLEQCNCVSELIWTKFNPHPWTICFHSAIMKANSENN